MQIYARSSARIEQRFPKPLVGGSNPLGRAEAWKISSAARSSNPASLISLCKSARSSAFGGNRARSQICKARYRNFPRLNI